MQEIKTNKRKILSSLLIIACCIFPISCNIQTPIPQKEVSTIKPTNSPEISSNIPNQKQNILPAEQPKKDLNPLEEMPQNISTPSPSITEVPSPSKTSTTSSSGVVSGSQDELNQKPSQNSSPVPTPASSIAPTANKTTAITGGIKD